MARFLIVEGPQGEKAVFYNVSVLEAEDDEQAESKYLEKCSIDFSKSDLDIINLDELDEDFFYYYEIDVKKSNLMDKLGDAIRRIRKG